MGWSPRTLPKQKAPNNRTLTLSAEETDRYAAELLTLRQPASVASILNQIIYQSVFDALPLLPDAFVDLLIVDPPYNRPKDFNGSKFRSRSPDAYLDWLASWVSQLP
ncbi:MAG: site-specific DNA-methyltransferase, partial [Cyanobacteria bacterium J06643_4]